MNSDQVQDYVTALSSYFGAVTAGLESTYAALNQSRDSILASRDEIMLSGMSGQQQSDYYKKKASEEFYALAGLSSEDVPAAIDQMHADLMKYYDLEKANIQDKYKTEIDALNEKHDVEIRNIEAIQNKLLSLRYSNFNLALPTAKAASASQDYSALFAAAQTGDADAVSKYLSFTDTALQASMDANKSSKAYLDFYAQVMRDIASLDTSAGVSIEELTKTQTDEITRLNDQMANELKALDASVTEALSYMTTGLEMRITDVTSELVNIYNLLAGYVAQAYAGTQSVPVTTRPSGGKVNTPTSPFVGYADGGWPSGPDSGYLAMLHGEEVVLSKPRAVSNVSSGMGDPEVKNLLTALVAQGSKRQYMTIVLEDGRELKAYVRSTADELDDIRQTRNVRGSIYK